MNTLNNLPYQLQANLNCVQHFSSRFVAITGAEQSPRYHFFGNDDLSSMLSLSRLWMEKHDEGWAFTATYDRVTKTVMHSLARLGEGRVLNLERVAKEIESEL